MIGPCETCAYWQPEERDGLPVERLAHPGGTTVAKVCMAGPVHLPTTPLHRCGQHRIREELTGGTDARTSA